MPKGDYNPAQRVGVPAGKLPGRLGKGIYQIEVAIASETPIVFNVSAYLADGLPGERIPIDVWREGQIFNPKSIQWMLNAVKQDVNIEVLGGSLIQVTSPAFIAGLYEVWIQPGEKSWTSNEGLLCSGTWVEFI